MSIKIVVFISPEQEIMAQVSQWFTDLRDQTLTESGCIQFDVYQHEEDFVLIEEWQDQAAIDQHMNEDYTKHFIQLTKGKIKQTNVYRLTSI